MQVEQNVNVESILPLQVNKNYRIYSKYIKRSLDISFSLVGIVITAPVMLLIAIMIKISSPGPVFYRGIRTGRFEKPFKIIKFRSMVANAEDIGGGTTALNDRRITRIGHFLRKTKLDEIPQLVNVLLGEMSFIGPRPELQRYTDLYDQDEKVILTVRPGITDLSSIMFISLDEIVGAINPDEIYEKVVLSRKNKMRIDYVNGQSFALDTKILLATVWKVISRDILMIFGQKSKGE